VSLGPGESQASLSEADQLTNMKDPQAVVMTFRVIWPILRADWIDNHIFEARQEGSNNSLQFFLERSGLAQAGVPHWSIQPNVQCPGGGGRSRDFLVCLVYVRLMTDQEVEDLNKRRELGS